MNTKHTPGPWHVRNGNTIGDATQDIASLSIMSVVNMKKDERIANARLIAAAPELLDVLKEIISDGVHCDVVPHLHYKARAAIAKATGIQS